MRHGVQLWPPSVLPPHNVLAYMSRLRIQALFFFFWKCRFYHFFLLQNNTVSSTLQICSIAKPPNSTIFLKTLRIKFCCFFYLHWHSHCSASHDRNVHGLKICEITRYLPRTLLLDHWHALFLLLHLQKWLLALAWIINKPSGKFFWYFIHNTNIFSISNRESVIIFVIIVDFSGPEPFMWSTRSWFLKSGFTDEATEWNSQESKVWPFSKFFKSHVLLLRVVPPLCLSSRRFEIVIIGILWIKINLKTADNTADKTSILLLTATAQHWTWSRVTRWALSPSSILPP